MRTVSVRIAREAGDRPGLRPIEDDGTMKRNGAGRENPQRTKRDLPNLRHATFGDFDRTVRTWRPNPETGELELVSVTQAPWPKYLPKLQRRTPM
jgi:hypothetical protein